MLLTCCAVQRWSVARLLVMSLVAMEEEEEGGGL